MKVKEILPYGIVALVSLVVGIILTLLITNILTAKTKLSASFSQMFGLSESKPSSYIAKIGNYYLSTEEFNREYMLVIDTISGGDPAKKSLYLNDLSTKRNYLESLINELAVVIEAYNQGFLSSSEWETLSKISLRKAVVDSFLAKKIDISKIQVTEEEIERAYQQNKEYFRQNNIPANKAEELLRIQIRNQKLQKELANYVQTIRDKLSIEKVEENIK